MFNDVIRHKTWKTSEQLNGQRSILLLYIFNDVIRDKIWKTSDHLMENFCMEETEQKPGAQPKNYISTMLYVARTFQWKAFEQLIWLITLFF